MMSEEILSPIKWEEGSLLLLDQRRLPAEEIWMSCRTLDDCISAIKEMVVRGAPAIGITAAYSAVIAYQELVSGPEADARGQFELRLKELAASRPTAVNLAWAVDKIRDLAAQTDWKDLGDALLILARSIHETDLAANLKMAELGADIITAGLEGKFSILTHCNTGSLATGGYGTALGVIRSVCKRGVVEHIYADETRPWLQGARLTAWELQKDNLPVVLNADASAAWLMKTQNIRWVVVGADRITANGDVANKIGTYSLAVLARHHGVKFMVVAPESTVDMTLNSGQEIEIEERGAEELTRIGDSIMAPPGLEVANPVFDVTPAELIDVIVTDRGAVHRPDSQAMKAVFEDE